MHASNMIWCTERAVPCAARTQAELRAPVNHRAQAAWPFDQVLQVHQAQQVAQLRLRDHVARRCPRAQAAISAALVARLPCVAWQERLCAHEEPLHSACAGVPQQSSSRSNDETGPRGRQPVRAWFPSSVADAQHSDTKGLQHTLYPIFYVRASYSLLRQRQRLGQHCVRGQAKARAALCSGAGTG